MAKSAFGGASFNSFLLGFVGCLYLLDTIVGPAFAKLPAASSKPYDNFDDFFPFYLEEHSELTNRRLHFIGTTISLLLAASQPMTLLAMAYSGARRPCAVRLLVVPTASSSQRFAIWRVLVVCTGYVGTFFRKWLMHQSAGFLEAAVLLTLFLIVSSKWTGKVLRPLSILLVGYTFAW